MISRLGGESAGGEWSTSKMAKCSAGVNFDLGNGFFWKSATLSMQVDVGIDLHCSDHSRIWRHVARNSRQNPYILI